MTAAVLVALTASVALFGLLKYWWYSSFSDEGMLS
jgi:hypothetical protein